MNDILLKTIKNNIVACLCNVFYTNLSLWSTTIQYNTDILFPIKEPFRAEQSQESEVLSIIRYRGTSKIAGKL